jgi:hypothetical protein
MDKANRDLNRIIRQGRSGLLSTTPSSSQIKTEQPVLPAAELELITKFPPSILFCFHGRLYFERCNRCKRTKSEGQDNLQRFKNKVTDFS